MGPSLAAELLLIAYDDETGKSIGSTTNLDFGLGGALLVDLAIAGRIDVEDKRVELLDTTPLGDSELDHALERIASEGRARKPSFWVSRLSKGVRGRLLEQLADAGVLEEERKRVLGLFKTTRFPSADSGVEDAALDRVRDALTSRDQTDDRTAALASLLNATKLLKRVLPKPDKARLKELEQGQWASDAVRKAIQSVDAAVIAATSVAATSGATAAN